MPKKADLSKEEKIKKEKARLRRVFKDLDENKRRTVDSLIERAAFLTTSLEELENEINEKGYISEYKNGENQFGEKQSDAVKTHIAMTKNLAVIIKQLTEIAPQAPPKQKSRLQLLRDE